MPCTPGLGVYVATPLASQVTVPLAGWVAVVGVPSGEPVGSVELSFAFTSICTAVPGVVLALSGTVLTPTTVTVTVSVLQTTVGCIAEGAVHTS